MKKELYIGAKVKAKLFIDGKDGKYKSGYTLVRLTDTKDARYIVSKGTSMYRDYAIDVIPDDDNNQDVFKIKDKPMSDEQRLKNLENNQNALEGKLAYLIDELRKLRDEIRDDRNKNHSQFLGIGMNNIKMRCSGG